MTKNTLACDLTRVPEAVRARLTGELRALFAQVEEVRPLPDGFALRFPVQEGPGLIGRLGEIVDYDRLCCPFLGHAIVHEPGAGPVWLHFTGGEGVPEFLAAELEPLLPRGIAGRP